MKPIAPLLASIFLAAAPPAAAQQPQKILKDRSAITFVVKQMGVAVDGGFKRFDGTIAFDPARPEATRAELEVDLASIDAGSPDADTEARRKPWLNIEAFPKARFVATSVKALGPGRYEAAGELTIKGVTRKVVAPIRLTEQGGTRTVEGQFPLERLAFRIGEGPWSDTETVANEVLVRFRFTIPANR